MGVRLEVGHPGGRLREGCRAAEHGPGLGDEVRVRAGPDTRARGRASWPLGGDERDVDRATRPGTHPPAERAPASLPPAPRARRARTAPRVARNTASKGRHLRRDQLRLARLLVVDRPLTIRIRSATQSSRAACVRRVEDDDLGGAGRVVEREEDHRLAALRRHLLDVRDDPANRDLSPSRRRSSSASVASVLRRNCSRTPCERVFRDVEPERFLLEPQQLGLLELAGRDQRVVPRARPRRRRPPCRRTASSAPSAGPARASAPSRSPARAARASLSGEARGRSKAPHLTSASSARLLTTCGSTRSVKSQIEAKGRPPRPRPTIALRRRVPDVLDRLQPEPDLALDDGEVHRRLVHVRWEHLDPHLVARVDVERDAVLRVHHAPRSARPCTRRDGSP